MITREMVIFDSLSLYINILEESTHIIDSLGRNLSLNLTHHFVGQIWRFSTLFVFHTVLPVKGQLLIARFRDMQWRQIWCIVGLKVDQNKTTAVRVTVKRRIQ